MVGLLRLGWLDTEVGTDFALYTGEYNIKLTKLLHLQPNHGRFR